LGETALTRLRDGLAWLDDPHIAVNVQRDPQVPPLGTAGGGAPRASVHRHHSYFPPPEQSARHSGRTTVRRSPRRWRHARRPGDREWRGRTTPGWIVRRQVRRRLWSDVPRPAAFGSIRAARIDAISSARSVDFAWFS